jgi:hypothetical protein
MKSLDDQMRDRFHELGAIKAKVDAELEPLNAAMTLLHQQAAAIAVEQKKVAVKMKAIRDAANLFDLDMERGRLANALGGKTGVPPSAE